MLTSALSAWKSLMRVMAADSRVSPVSALKANPSTAMRWKKHQRQRRKDMHIIEKRTYLAGDGIEKCVNNVLRETFLLILVHLHNLSPICGNLWQVQALAQVHKVEDIFLEARTAETNGGTKEFVADT